MNIFFLDKSPALAARAHIDKHVVKMILELAQLLSTAHHILTPSPHPSLYAACYVNHPCGKWVRASVWNYRWTYELFKELCKEYTYRYGKIHATESKLLHVLAPPPTYIPGVDMTPPAQAMPDDCKDGNAVVAYRNYYNTHKRSIATWTRRQVPTWWKV